MDTTRFDRLTRLFAGRGMSRREALQHGGAGLAAGALAATGLGTTAAAQDSTPASDTASEGPSFLFVQTFEGGAIAPEEGEDGVYTLTLDHNSGQTIYFADRPDRDVGTLSTADFLALPLFAGDNPPNAALVVEPEPGVTEIAVVELLDPVHDAEAGTLTYDVVELADYSSTLTVGLTEDPTDLAALLPEFGSAHLFIDSVPIGDLPCSPESAEVYCYRKSDNAQIGSIGVGLYYWRPCHDGNLFLGCRPYECYNDQCNATYTECEGQCWSHSPEIDDCAFCR